MQMGKLSFVGSRELNKHIKCPVCLQDPYLNSRPLINIFLAEGGVLRKATRENITLVHNIQHMNSLEH